MIDSFRSRYSEKYQEFIRSITFLLNHALNSKSHRHYKITWSESCPFQKPELILSSTVFTSSYFYIYFYFFLLAQCMGKNIRTGYRKRIVDSGVLEHIENDPKKLFLAINFYRCCEPN